MLPFRAFFQGFVVLGAIASAAQGGESARQTAATTPIFGHLDPVTNVFTPAPRDVAPQAAATPAPAAAPLIISGTMNVTVNVAFAATFPVSATTTASVNLTSVPPTGATKSYTTTINRIGAVVRSGNTGRVTIALPLALNVTGATDKLALTTTLSTSTGEYATATQPLPLPANGATTNVAVWQRFGG